MGAKHWSGVAFSSLGHFWGAGDDFNFSAIQVLGDPPHAGWTLLRTIGDIHLQAKKPDLVNAGDWGDVQVGLHCDRGFGTFPGLIQADDPLHDWLHNETAQWRVWEWGAGAAPFVGWDARMHVDTPAQRRFVANDVIFQLSCNQISVNPGANQYSYTVNAFFRILLEEP